MNYHILFDLHSICNGISQYENYQGVIRLYLDTVVFNIKIYIIIVCWLGIRFFMGEDCNNQSDQRDNLEYSRNWVFFPVELIEA